MKILFTFIFTLTTIYCFAQNLISTKRIQEFDQYVDQVRKEWDVPGLSITVVKDGNVIFKKGYGVRELGKPDKVDTQTLFACASTTKAMTAAVLGSLVDEGKMSWDDPVIRYMPELKLYDPYVTRELRVRDLLLHNTGLASTDFFGSMMNISANEIFNKLQYVKPSYSFRSSYEYQNTMYAVAGRVIERVSGKPWTEALIERIFKPLGMTQTVPRRILSNSNNITKPHYPVNDSIKILDYGRDSEIGTAGAVWSNADDMSLWVKCMLDSSKYEGGRLLNPETWAEIFRPQTMFPTSEYPTLTILKPNWQTYSLGWYNHDYKGKKVNFHTGSLAGLIAIIGLLPEEKLGVYIFGNYDHAEVRHALMYKTFDWFALGGDRDWNGEFKVLYSKLKAEQKKAMQDFENKRITNTKTSLPLAAYHEIYTSPLYGKIEVRQDADKLAYDINDYIKTSLLHWHYDTFYGTYGKYNQYKIQASFDLNANGKPTTLTINGMEFKKVEAP